jgi:methylenetetrahydrofolate reductase (NADPH)
VIEMAAGPHGIVMSSQTASQSSASVERMGRFLSGSSIEIVPRGADPIGAVRRHMPAGTAVYVTCVPGEDYGRIIALSAQLRRAGFIPVPHLPARSVASFRVLDDRLGRLAGEAGVDRLLVLGGDVPDHRVGAFASALQVLETGLLSRHGFTAVGLATYPEPHPVVATPLLESELRKKLATAADEGLEQWLVSQFSFDADIVIRHARRLRAISIDAPLHVGVSGPASWVAMAKFALICGFANSARSLSRSAARFGRLLGGFEPTRMLSKLAESAVEAPALGLAAPHFFSFGGSERTAEYIKSLAARTA